MKYFFLILLLLISKTAHAKEIQGTPLVVDGDTIKINLNKIRLEGIDAPEIKQQCKKKYSKNLTFFSLIKKNYSCGIVSKKKLIAKINTSKIKCISSSKDRYKRYLATCYKDKTNLNKWMVRNGLAVAYKKYSEQYIEDELYAKKNQLGIWQGSFVRPEKWRKLN